MSRPTVTTLGPVSVTGEVRQVALSGTNLPTLLCLLALTPGRSVANDRLIAALWPDTDLVRGRRSLTSLVHQLNLMIDPVLGIDRTVRTVKGVGRMLHLDPLAIDVVRFERGVVEGEAHAVAGRHEAAVTELIDALALWRGRPFGGIELPALVEPAAQLASTRARAETLLIDSGLRVGRAGDLLGLLEGKVDAHPENEFVVASLARALYQVGRHHEASAVVDRCVALLHGRGIDPTPRLRRLATAIATRSLVDREQGVAPQRSTAGPRLELIGRHFERAGIGNWFVGATAPRSLGRALIISGDPGIGKTAVLDAWLRGMGDSVLAIRTRCSPEQILPFEAFGPLLTSVVASEGHTEFVDDIHTREQLFHRVAERLRSMSDTRATVVAIDDAHWLTPSSVALLEHLVRSDCLANLRFVLTLRHHEAAANEPLRQLIDAWRVDRRVETLALGPLSDNEITLLAARHIRPQADRGAPALGAADLRALTGGNPLFVIQVVQAGADPAALPSTVEHLLGRYLDGAPLGVRRGVETAALLGMDGSLARLARCTGREELVEIEALDEVGDGRLLYLSPINGSYRFVHQLAQQTVVAQIPPGRAMRLHLAIADGLETERRQDVFAIAHHLRLAVPAAATARASAALLRAARHARELGDFDTSKNLAQQALALTEDGALQADAYVLMASGAQSLGQREAAARHIRTAVDLALQSNATAVLAHALFVKSAVMCFWGDDGLAARIEQSIGGLFVDESSGSSDGSELVEVVWALCLDHPGHALRARQVMAERVLDIARASGNPLSTLRALHANQMVGQMVLSDPHLVLGWGTEALRLAEQHSRPTMAAQVRLQSMSALLRAGQFAEARAMQAHHQVVQSDGADLALRWTTHAISAGIALVDDDLVRAERLVREARDIGEPLAGTRPAEEYINHMGVLHLARGSLPGLHHLFGAWVDQLPGPVWHWAVGSDELLDPMEPHAIERRETLVTHAGSPLPPHSQWLPELTIAAEYAYRSSDHELGKLLVRCIEPFAHQHAVLGVGLTLGSMWRPYALALAATGDERNAREAMATAQLVNAGAGLNLWVRLSRLAS